MSSVSGLERDVLMELQYRFPETSTPYCDVAERLGVETSTLLGALRRLRSIGVLKRVGFYVNYRSERLRAALIAIAAGRRVEEIAREVFASDPYATHVYERNHPIYNLWVVTKRPSLEELMGVARSIEERYGVDTVLLYGKRTLKLSVKYDLYEGVSRSGPYWRVSQNPPPPEAYGLTPAKMRLYRSLPLEERPYRVVADRLGLSEEEAAGLAWRMLRDGALGDPGAALDGHKAGFKINIMLTTRDSGGMETCSCLAGLPFTTHVVYRTVHPPGKWEYPCYAMIHAVDRERADRLVRTAVSRCGLEDFFLLESLRDLKPGVVR